MPCFKQAIIFREIDIAKLFGNGNLNAIDVLPIQIGSLNCMRQNGYNLKDIGKGYSLPLTTTFGINIARDQEAEQYPHSQGCSAVEEHLRTAFTLQHLYLHPKIIILEL